MIHPPGPYTSAEDNSSSAVQCAPGTYADTKGRVTCLPCPASPNATYQPYEGKSTCLACPDGAEQEVGPGK